MAESLLQIPYVLGKGLNRQGREFSEELMPSFKQQIPIAPSHPTRLDEASGFEGKCQGFIISPSAHQGELLNQDGGGKKCPVSLEQLT